MITDLCDKHQAIISSAADPEQALRRLLRRAMNKEEGFRRAVQTDTTESFEPLCCHVGDAAVTDAKLDRLPDPDPALDPKLIPVAEKLRPKDGDE